MLLDRCDKKFIVEILRTKDGCLTSYQSYCSWAALERLAGIMPRRTTLERASFIVIRAICDQFGIIERHGHIEANFKESLKLLFVQAWADLSNGDGTCEYN